jgi:hypothetical protein
MKSKIRSLAASLLFAVALVAPLAILPARAASVVMCAPTESGKPEGPRRVVNPNTNNAYGINSAGCLVVQAADIGWFVSQGFTVGSPYAAVTLSGITVTNAGPLTIPVGTFIRDIIVQETSGSAMSGLLRVGTTSGAGNILSGSVFIAALSTTVVSDAAFATAGRVFATSSATNLYLTAASGTFGSASLAVTVIYGYF